MPLALLDRYILRLTSGPMLACLAATMLAFLAERTLRLLTVLTPTGVRLGTMFELTSSLVPHFLGLTLPVAFFIALLVVVTRLDEGSEIAAVLASGFSLRRIAEPLLWVSLVLTVFSVALFGYLQPYARYAYRAAFHAAANAGWSGELAPGQVIMEGGQVITADRAGRDGRSLMGVFLRQARPDGEDVLTASRAELEIAPDEKTARLVLHDGVQLHLGRARTSLLNFHSYSMELPLTGAMKLLRSRGGDQRELTMGELYREAQRPHPFLPRRTLLAELYARLARAAVLPFLPLLAFPLGLAAKRAGRAPGLILGGVLLLAYEAGIQFGESFAKTGAAPPEAAIGAPFVIFAALSVWIFLGSARRPGETPLSLISQTIGDGVRTLTRRAPSPS